jgi:hypothetical protein
MGSFEFDLMADAVRCRRDRPDELLRQGYKAWLFSRGWEEGQKTKEIVIHSAAHDTMIAGLQDWAGEPLSSP